MTIDFNKIKTLLEQEEINKREVPQNFVDFLLELIERQIQKNNVSPYISESGTLKILFFSDHVTVTVLGEDLKNFGDKYSSYYPDIFAKKNLQYTKVSMQKDYGDNSITFKLNKLPAGIRGIVN